MAENKVQFNLKNVHYAIATVDPDDGSVTYGTPKHVPGAVNLSLEARGEVSPFYADGIVYYQSPGNNGYEGDLEMARFSDGMLQDLWGYSLGGTSKVLTEEADAAAVQFALLFEIDGDADEQYYVFYNCTGSRPGVASTTNTDTIEPQTMTSTITANPLADGRIMARTTAATPTATKEAWFTTVFEES